MFFFINSHQHLFVPFWNVKWNCWWHWCSDSQVSFSNFCKLYLFEREKSNPVAEMRASLWLPRKFFFWASKKFRVTGPNGIMVAQTFCDIFFLWKMSQKKCHKKKDIRYMYQYINSFQINCFFINVIKIHSFPSLTGVGGLFKVILVQVCSWNCKNTPMHILLSNETWIYLL